ncbi:hypothetical protein OKA06_19725 [Novosphingobium sp. MW5]|nr:hypothetical protein [Novosphingobium sp. MW5]
MNVGANYLREHMPQEARLHYAATDAGGSAPNVVQARAESLYMIRAPELDDLHALIARVDDVARGAALMTGTQVEIIGEGGAANVLPNAALCAVMHQAMLALGTLNFARDELAFAQAIRDSLGDTAAADRRAQTEGDALLPQGHGRLPLHSGLRCFSGRIEQGTGSTDVGDVSWQIPVVEAALATWAVGTPSHTWQAVAQGRSSGRAPRDDPRGQCHGPYRADADPAARRDRTGTGRTGPAARRTALCARPARRRLRTQITAVGSSNPCGTIRL